MDRTIPTGKMCQFVGSKVKGLVEVLERVENKR